MRLQFAEEKSRRRKANEEKRVKNEKGRQKYVIILSCIDSELQFSVLIQKLYIKKLLNQFQLVFSLSHGQGHS